MFPHAKYVYWVRNPRDCILRPHKTDNLADFGVEYPHTEDKRQRRASSWKYQYDIVKATPKPANWLEIRFEDFVQRQDKILARLETVLGFKLAKIPVWTDSVDRWKTDDETNYYDFMAPAMNAFRYETFTEKQECAGADAPTHSCFSVFFVRVKRTSVRPHRPLKETYMTEPAIAVQNLTYRYGDLTAVDHIDFEIAPGEVFGFLGPNGAGKTTTVKMLTGQLRPAEGRATVLGLDIEKNTSQVQQQLGVAFETNNLYEQLTAVENLNLFARLFGVQNFDAFPLLENVGLSGREKERVTGYSKGMKQRLMVARALVNRPRILFLDEPTAGLDPVSSQTIQAIIQEAAAAGATVFLCTHDMVEADKLSDRVAFINEGQIVALDKPAKLKQQYGKRQLKVEVESANGESGVRNIALDREATPQDVYELFKEARVVTIHSEEATLEDIFVQITGRGLLG